MYVNSQQYLSHDLYGDSQWQILNSPLAGSDLECKEIICSYIVLNKNDSKKYNNILLSTRSDVAVWYKTLMFVKSNLMLIGVI